MEWRGFPPLSALRAFAAFAQAPTLDQAGALIGVTHAAISQQIRALETQMGVALVDRGGRRLALTDEGRRLAEALEAGFGQIATVVAELTGSDGSRPLRITTTPSFASGWLLPRLPEFRAQHPGIDLVIDPAPEQRDIGREADVGLRYGNGDWPGLEARLVLRSSVVVVASPGLVPADGPQDAAHLAKLPWLQEPGTNEVTGFLQQYGLTREKRAGMISLPGNMMLDAARDGQGVAVVARAFVLADLAAGRLRLLHEDKEHEGYFLVTRPGVLRPPLKAFAQWVLRQADAGPGQAI
ncbi:LysR family transcriptional regulator [Gemmobacter fulvus]|uniref:LysR family transcriptional regulator n=1 Tax=Gemmobacter fulvus TaxID=2840474 RepID=A0A975P4W8_9RHOB|nr:LysR family transcriptional regulator [Gemmobacter fulvus]MBT9246939.1 LysR family transcriptional regulator [Gemmobacter fulvus]QWK89714.1 LysR family transcriptional regulator [Gemmobacter fulvus]